MSPLQTTSSARPAAPWEGQTIYDTDTNIGYQYDGTNWGPTYPGSGFRNLIINGAMQISQRVAVGTAVTGITTAGYNTADRWRTDVSSLGTWTQTTIADAPTGSGFCNSLKLACTTADASPAAGDYLVVQQKIEGQNLQAIRKGTASAQTLTLSFWVKSFQTGTFIAELQDINNSRACSKAYTVAVSNTWEYKTLLFPADTTGALTNDANQSLVLNFWLGAGTTYTSGTLQTTWGTTTDANRCVGVTNLASSTSNNWFITGVQFEANPQPTPFEQRPYGTELALCQRYYYKIDATRGSTNSRIGTGFVYNTTAQALVTFPVEMRTSPTHENSTPVGNFQVYNGLTAVAVTAFAQDTSSPNNFNINIGLGSAMTTNGAQLTRNVNATPCFFAFNAEL